MKRSYYITTPIYYVNAKPHLGTLYSSLIADILARLNRLSGKDVFFLTGTDEHGQKVEEKARELNVAPQAFVDSMVGSFKEAWLTYEIGFDKFIRTTDPGHKQAVLAVLEKMLLNNDIYKEAYKGWYCVPCESFVTNAQETQKQCPTCKRALEYLEEDNYFFRLSAYQEDLLAFYDANPDFIMPKERFNEVRSFVQSGLKDLSITRTGITWGIPFPGDPEHVIYVWLDALVNYISAIGYGSSNSAEQATFEKFWPADVHVMAKDIVRFHAVYWPAFLMSVGLPLPKKLLVHGYVLASAGEKMSKSLGNSIDPLELAKQYGVEQVRYYLARQMPISHDGHFSIEDLENRITSDLANALGNLQSRVIALALNHNLVNVIAPSVWEPVSIKLHNRSQETVDLFWDEMVHGRFHTGLAAVWTFIADVNAYFNDNKPWELAKNNRPLFEEVIAATVQSIHAIALMVWPVMPRKMEALLESIGMPFALGTDYETILRTNKWTTSFVLTKVREPLFARVETAKKNEIGKGSANEQVQQKESLPVITIEDFAKVELIVGTIRSCEFVEGSDKLYKLQVDMGQYGVRQILSGVRKHLSPDALIGKQGVVVANLPPRKMLGNLSEGMMLYASDDTGSFCLTTVDGTVKDGTRLS